MDSNEHPEDWRNKQRASAWDLRLFFKVISLKNVWFSVLENYKFIGNFTDNF